MLPFVEYEYAFETGRYESRTFLWRRQQGFAMFGQQRDAGPEAEVSADFLVEATSSESGAISRPRTTTAVISTSSSSVSTVPGSVSRSSAKPCGPFAGADEFDHAGEAAESRPPDHGIEQQHPVALWRCIDVQVRTAR